MRKVAVVVAGVPVPPLDNYLKRLKINYILIGVVTLLLALALWPNITWRSGGRATPGDHLPRRVAYQHAEFTADLFQHQARAGWARLRTGEALRQLPRGEAGGDPHQNINDLFDDLDDDDADLLAAGLIYNQERLSRARTGPAYYSVSQQLVYRLGTLAKGFADIKGKLAVASGSAHVSTLKQLKQDKYPDLAWESSSDLTSKELLERVADGKLDYTLGDSVTIALLQRIHPQLAVAFDVTDEEPVTWYLKRDGDDSLYAAMLDFYSQMVDDGTWRGSKKYLGHVGSFDYVDTKTFLSAIDSVLPNFRPLFEKHANEIDWKLLAAIAYQESHWNPQATSPTGVRGLMMLTRATADGRGSTTASIRKRAFRAAPFTCNG